MQTFVEKNAAPYNSTLNLSACRSDVHLVDRIK